MNTVKAYRNRASWLAAFILPISLVTLLTTSLAEKANSDIEKANQLAASLSVVLSSQAAGTSMRDSMPAAGAPSAADGQTSSEPAPVRSTPSARAPRPPGALARLRTWVSSEPQPCPPLDSGPMDGVVDPTGSATSAAASETQARHLVIQDLQELAARTRAIDRRAREMRWFAFGLVDDPFEKIRGCQEALHKKFELPQALGNLPAALSDRIEAFEGARDFAQNAAERIWTWYGAFVVGVFPMLYAMLGACVFLLRQYQDQLRAHTFTGQDGHYVRLCIAAILGGVVGLLRSALAGDGVSIWPLAVAFLVGYASEVFFSFLDTFVHSFSRGGGSAPRRARK